MESGRNGVTCSGFVKVHPNGCFCSEGSHLQFCFPIGPPMSLRPPCQCCTLIINTANTGSFTVRPPLLPDNRAFDKYLKSLIGTSSFSPLGPELFAFWVTSCHCQSCVTCPLGRTLFHPPSDPHLGPGPLPHEPTPISWACYPLLCPKLCVSPALGPFGTWALGSQASGVTYASRTLPLWAWFTPPPAPAQQSLYCDTSR